MGGHHLGREFSKGEFRRKMPVQNEITLSFSHVTPHTQQRAAVRESQAGNGRPVLFVQNSHACLLQAEEHEPEPTASTE